MAHHHEPDTIAAIATPPGSGGVGIVRLSGPRSRAILAALFLSHSPSFSDFKPYCLHHGALLAVPGDPATAVDEVLAVCMPGPRSFTGEDVAEIHCHGGQAVVAAVLEAVLAQGARLAERGEFTRRAFLNGRMDLTQAEAVAEIIAAPAQAGLRLAQARLEGGLGRRIRALRARLESLRQQLCVAVDFPDEELECLSRDEFVSGVSGVRQEIDGLLHGYARCRCWRDGALVVLAGRVNAGKSSLLNALLGRNRAIVTDVPGTTRDFLEETIDLAGLPVRLVDTAGLRDAAHADAVEREGVRLGRDLADKADLVCLVWDATLPPDADGLDLARRLGARKVLGVANKIDLAGGGTPGETETLLAALGVGCARVCAKNGEGVDALAVRIRSHLLEGGGACAEPEYGELAPNLRQSRALAEARDELAALAEEIDAHVPYDLLGVRLEAACRMLCAITGEITSDDILRAIFDSFCIGK
ncbi:MAG: tRNA uridine-5-carboxymethylaminomethyl(34) synthesis GTPase MnmE [Desulfovibrionaceae bacterium]